MVLFLAGCGLDQQAAGPNTKSDATLPTGNTSRQGTAEGVFQTLSLEQALQKAKADGKVVMVDFYTVWCPPCKLLDQKTWPDDKVQDWLREKTVAVKIDAEKEEALAAKYGITSYPTLLFVNPSGSELGRIKSFVNPEDFLKRAGDLLAESGK